VQLTFSNPSNAVRAFRQYFPELAEGLDGNTIKGAYLDRNSINIGLVALAQADRKGEATHNLLLGVPVLRKSAGGSAVARAHSLFASLPAGTTRRDAIAAAVDQGVAFYTARTQYQRWIQG
jgi:hypothetical protein